MKSTINILACLFIVSTIYFTSACNSNSNSSKDLISDLNLKKGNVISCGDPGKEFGAVNFDMSCDASVKEEFNLAMEMLHSFEYDESEKMFAKVIEKAPDCAMAFWGVAMSNFHPLWNPPTEAELIKGSKAIVIAKSISGKSEKETAYIDAIAAFYNDWQHNDHSKRCLNFEKAMEDLHARFPGDKEASIFYALALDAAADPTDKSYARQKKAGDILNALYPGQPDHPGIIHYIIHTYDYPGLASQALSAARKYAQVAASSAHALHMPSHIFTRLGLWDESIKSNLVSVSAAKCYAESAGIKGHWDEELHGLDYLVYAYLQRGENSRANEQLRYLQTINNVEPQNLKVAYAFAAIPSRITLENKDWNAAAVLTVLPANFPWEKYPWQEAIIHFTRMIGSAKLKKADDLNVELGKLKQLHAILEQQKDVYKTRQVAIQVKTGEALLEYVNGNTSAAITGLHHVAAMEDSTAKHPVTPGEVYPVRELLASLYLELGQNSKALAEFETVLRKSPNRFNAVYGAAMSAEKSGSNETARAYFKLLRTMTDPVKCERPEMKNVSEHLKGENVSFLN